MIGCDPIVAANKATLAVIREGRSFVALNTHGAPTASFVHNPDWQFPGVTLFYDDGKVLRWEGFSSIDVPEDWMLLLLMQRSPF